MYENYLEVYEQLKTAENKSEALKDLLKESFQNEEVDRKVLNGYIFNHKKNVAYSYPKETNELLHKYKVLPFLVTLTKKQVKELGLERFEKESNEKDFSFSAKRSKINVVKEEEFKEEFDGLSQEELLELLKAAKIEEGRLKGEEANLKAKCKTESKDADVSFEWGTFKWKTKTELDLKAVQEEMPEALVHGKLSRTKLNEAILNDAFEDYFGDDYDDLIEQLKSMEIATVKEPSVQIISEEAYKAQLSMLK